MILNDKSLELYGQYSWINLDQYNMAPGIYILKLKEKEGTQLKLYRFVKK
jgi:hypothetical protein